MRRQITHSQTPKKRLGAAAVELALVLPVFLTLTFGAVEVGYAINVSQKLESIVRDAGRLAAKDIDPALLVGGITPNQKVINDVRNMMRAEGYNTANVAVTIVHADGATAGQSFDLSLATNQYKMMKIRVTIPYTDVRILKMRIASSTVLDATLVVSRGRSTLSF